jgi:hypothetical protein
MPPRTKPKARPRRARKPKPKIVAGVLVAAGGSNVCARGVKVVTGTFEVKGSTSFETGPDPVLQAAFERINRLERREQRAREAKSEAKKAKYKKLATDYANRVDGKPINAPLKTIAPELKTTRKGKVVRATERTLRRALEHFPEAWGARKGSGRF